MDEGFLDKIDGPFICLTAAILCHALRCWRTGTFINNVAFTRASSKGIREMSERGPRWS